MLPQYLVSKIFNTGTKTSWLGTSLLIVDTLIPKYLLPIQAQSRAVEINNLCIQRRLFSGRKAGAWLSRRWTSVCYVEGNMPGSSHFEISPVPVSGILSWAAKPIRTKSISEYRAEK